MLPLLGLLAVAVGLPFLVVSTTAPLLQRWLAATSHPATADPDFLYRASNLGSVLTAGVPTGGRAEPATRRAGAAVVGRLRAARGAGDGLRSGDVARAPGSDDSELTPTTPRGAGAPPSRAVHRRAGAPPSRASHRRDAPDPASPRTAASITLARRLCWIGLAFVPSSVMLGVTATITTDLAPLPLLWALPLSLYLLSLIVVFAPGARAGHLHGWMVGALPGVVLVLLSLILIDFRDPLWLVLPVHLIGFFVAALVCHGELARDRPPARSLTEFYLLISLGGALGGVFNAIVAPVLLDSLAEYPLAIVLAAFCLPKRPPRVPPGPHARRLDVGLPLAFGAVVALIVWLIGLAGSEAQLSTSPAAHCASG